MGLIRGDFKNKGKRNLFISPCLFFIEIEKRMDKKTIEKIRMDVMFVKWIFSGTL